MRRFSLERAAAAALMAFALGVSLSIVPVGAQPVHAASGLNQFRWANAGYTVSNTSYQYSNMSGFVQALVNSNGCSLTVDGVYGNQTLWWTAVAQNNLLGYNNSGVMNPAMWNAFQDARAQPGNFLRLVNTLITDGFGTRKYYYYGGYPINAELGWNPFVPVWLFSQYPVTNPNSLQQATTSRTIGSVPACS